MSMHNVMKCPLLGHSLVKSQQDGTTANYYLHCSVCGPYSLSPEAFVLIPNYPETVRRAAATYVRQCAERGVSPELLTTENIQAVAESYPPLPADEKVDRLLRLLAEDTDYPSGPANTRLEQYGLLVRASTDQEIHYLQNFLYEAGLVKRGSGGQNFITVQGWQKLWRERDSMSTSRRIFVAMSFDESLDEAYERGIRLGIEEAGFEPILIKKIHHNEKICDRIIAEIRQCGALVADFTGHRGGVYFEAGFAMGLGRPVIWLCRKDDLGNAHFDTRQYNHIPWESVDDLRVQLRERIIATLGEGRGRPTSFSVC